MNQSSISGFLRKNGLYGSKIGVAVSGGSDSVALFFALLSKKNEFSLELSLIHVNYHLRGDESDGDANFVRNLATDHSLPLYLIDVDLSNYTSGVEEQARRIRYDYFSKMRAEGSVDWIAVGHTRDDQAETVLFRLIRGTSLHGVGAMESIRNDGIIRPLLQEPGDSCRNWLRELGQSWREDSSNAGNDYSRNVIRHEIIPVLQKLNSAAVEHLVQFADHAREINSSIVATGLKQLRQRNLFASDLLFHFRRSVSLDSLEIAAIVHLLRERGCALHSVHTETVKESSTRAGKTALLPNRWRLYSSYKRIIFYHESQLPFSRGYWEELYRFDADWSEIRAIRLEDVIARDKTTPSAIKFLKKMGVPQAERAVIPVRVASNGVTFPHFL